MELENRVALLAEMPPSSWGEAVKRLSVLDAYSRIAKPSIEDAEEHARMLDVTLRSFYRLLAARNGLRDGSTPKPSQRGRQRGLSPEIEAIIASAIEHLGRETSERSVYLEVVERCRAAGLRPPSFNTIRTRSTSSTVDLRIRLGRRFDLVLDVCALDIDVTREHHDADAEVAFLSAVLRGSDGAILGHRLFAGTPDADELSRLILPVAYQNQANAVLVATGDTAGMLRSFEDELLHSHIMLNVAASRGLRPGAALVPVLGHKLGRITLTPRRLTSGTGRAVPLALAARIVDHLLS